MFAANKFRLIAFLSVALSFAPAGRAQQTYVVPPNRPNTVTEGVSLDAKRNFYQSMMMNQRDAAATQ